MTCVKGEFWFESDTCPRPATHLKVEGAHQPRDIFLLEVLAVRLGPAARVLLRGQTVRVSTPGHRSAMRAMRVLCERRENSNMNAASDARAVSDMRVM